MRLIERGHGEGRDLGEVEGGVMDSIKIHGSLKFINNKTILRAKRL